MASRYLTPAPARMTRTLMWRVRGWDLADHYRPDLADELGYTSDDDMRVAKVREFYPESMPSARTAMREGWRRHREGSDPW